MTETKYILTGDETHHSGHSLRAEYLDTEFPVVVSFFAENAAKTGNIYVADDKRRFVVAHNSGVKPKEAAAVGKVEYAFVGKGGDKITIPPNCITIKTDDVNWDAAKSLFDPVEKPEHYNTNLPEGVEAIDIIAAQTEHLSGLRAVCHANLLKYTLRWQKKNGVEDLKKARTYIDWLIEEIENNG